MSRVPIRLRLTFAFAFAMVLLLVAAGTFVYLRLESDLNEAIDDGLASRAQAIVPPPESPGRLDADAGAPGEAEDGFAQVLGRDGELIDSSIGLDRPVLSPDEAALAASRGLRLDLDVPGVDGTTRVLALPIRGAKRAAVAVAGQSLEDRDETLANLVASFAIGGPIAVLLASLLGYALARTGLAPVEAMRRRAGEISVEHGPEALLPLPAARDEIHRLGATLNEMLARLRASFERERRFVADASHELRTPITVIRAELDAALAAGDLGEEGRKAVVSAIEECDNLAALAEDMLVLARAADGELPVHRERLDPGELLDSVRARFIRRAEERGRAIRVEAEPGAEIDADRLRMRQALGNLVDNALRHGDGEIVLAARPAPDGGVAFSVADNGAGFDPELGGDAFERFTRADAARSGAGAGLGLAIVRAVAEAHGGSAEVVTGGPGATVRIEIPAQAAVAGDRQA